MADFKIFLILLFATETIAFYSVRPYYFKMKEVNGSDIYEHLKKSHIIKICNHRVEICSSNDTRVCTMRFVGDIDEYKHFNNSCYLFLSNMCDYPGKEYHIIDDDPCEVHESARRFTVQRRTNVTATNETTTGSSGKSSNATILFNSTDTSGNATYIENLEYNGTTPSSDFFLRGGTTTRIPLKYDIEEAFDDHKCPYSCPNFYSPICIIVNRGEGKYFKYFTFVNHCYGDMYYCKNYPEFAAAPELEYESVYASPLGWSYCGAQRYIQFARFSEVLSAMGHFGWLAGDHRYSHIMAPHERIPGFG